MNEEGIYSSVVPIRGVIPTIPTTGTAQLTIPTVVPKVVEHRIYTNGRVRLDAYVLEDGTIHIDPDAFEYILQAIGFLGTEEEANADAE